MLSFNEPQQTTQPAIYFVSLHAQSPQGEVCIYNAAVAAFSIQTAHTEAVAQLRDSDSDLFMKGNTLGGWHMKNHIELTHIRIDQMLVRAYDERDDIEKEKDKQERNQLMQTIIYTASRKLLNKYRHTFTTAEVEFMEDEIAKYEQNN